MNNVRELLDDTFDSLLKLVYALFYGSENWLYSPVIQAYERLEDFKLSMVKERISLPFPKQKSPLRDDVLGVWYKQADLGVPESERVQLNRDQQRSVEVWKELEHDVRLYELAIASIAPSDVRIGYSPIVLSRVVDET